MIKIPVYFKRDQSSETELGTITIYHGESILWDGDNLAVREFDPQTVVQVGGGLVFPFDDESCDSALRNLSTRLEKQTVVLKN